ncbi:MAG: hypothetical protein AAGA62_08765 [Bacteroidota bacterium]
MSEQHPYFPSGEWEGHYLEHGRKGPMRFQLDFTEGKITGTGGDNIGSFSWKGTYDVTTMAVKMTKQYLGKHQVSYEGMADTNGIYGSWSIPPWSSDGFHIWPVARAEEAQEVEEVVEEAVVSS